ncbi:progranulin-like isoform X2 [Macrobrachium nipponense]
MMQLLIFSSLLLAASVTAETCPGGLVRCPDFMTCCQLTSEKDYGCCPFPEAKCCSDHIHCCPHSMDCDIAHQACVRNGSSVQFQWYVPVNPEMAEPILLELEQGERNDVQQLTDTDKQERNAVQQQTGSSNECPDNTSCHSSFTCCKMYSGSYGCCPFNNGTCCMDGFHCCPHGSKCSPSGSCYSAEMNYVVHAYPLGGKFQKALKKKNGLGKPHHQEVSDPGGLCPDGHPCPERYTCCKISGKRYGCCPYSEAMCCDDGIHCCPKGTNCNTTLGTCDVQKTFHWSFPIHRLEALLWTESSGTPDNKVHVSDVVCPDERYHCPLHTTCCQLKSGDYGCCPMERATCCEDKEHCCPNGFQCTVGGCVRGTVRLPSFLRITPSQQRTSILQDGKTSLKTETNISSVICPDDYPCPDGNTCCELETGDYGCCPMEKATCCADKVHCCPHGYRCINDGCKKESEEFEYPVTINSTKLQRKFEDGKTSPRTETSTSSVVCPDGYPCPDGNTCCELETGDYGCCPMEKATCCADKVHCCPHGYRCINGGCQKESEEFEHPITINSTKLQRKFEVKGTETEGKHKGMPEEDLHELCPDQSECPDGATCCEVEEGGYGCCAYDKATCCGDKVHCCPHGYWCTDEGCDRMPEAKEHYAPFLLKLFNTKKTEV